MALMELDYSWLSCSLALKPEKAGLLSIEITIFYFKVSVLVSEFPASTLAEWKWDV
jgi:hypothetical protein